MPSALSLEAIVARLEAQLEFHQEKESFHAQQEEHHREQRKTCHPNPVTPSA